MAIDFIHTQQIVEAVRQVLQGSGTAHTGGLPIAWFKAEHQYSGVGLNDVTFSDGKTGTAGAFTVAIAAEGTPDTFKWKKDSGAYSAATAITGAAQTLSDGLTVTFAATTGHTADDTWVYDTSDVPLEWLEHGDFEDYTTGTTVAAITPCVFVKGLGPQVEDRGLAGCIETAERVRVVHLRQRSETYKTDGVTLESNLDIARQRYAKTLSDALFNDPYRRCAVIAADSSRTEVSLTCADANGAQVYGHRWVSTDLRGNTPEVRQAMALGRAADVWGIAIDSDVLVRSG